jgi:phage replication O-like protein O
LENPHKKNSKINPQKEQGHRQIENSVLTALIKARLTGSEYQLALTVIDRTWGYAKTNGFIPMRTFEGVTGLSHQGVLDGLKHLETRNILVVGRHGQGKKSEYLLNKHWDTWVEPEETGKAYLTSLETGKAYLTSYDEKPEKAEQPQTGKVEQSSLALEPTLYISPLSEKTNWSTTLYQTGKAGFTALVKQGLPELVKSSKLVGEPAKEIKKTIKENIKEKGVRGVYHPKKKYGEGNNVLLTEDEYTKLVQKFGKAGADARIENLSAYIASKGKKYNSHYFTILNWENMDKKQLHFGAGPGKFDGTPPKKYKKLASTEEIEKSWKK